MRDTRQGVFVRFFDEDIGCNEDYTIALVFGLFNETGNMHYCSVHYKVI